MHVTNLLVSYQKLVQLKWIEEPHDVEVKAGKPLDVPCTADGSPSPTIEWFRHGESDGSRPLGSHLRVYSASPDDTGVYECRAKNGAEPDLVARIKINVLGKYHLVSGCQPLLGFVSVKEINLSKTTENLSPMVAVRSI